MISNAKDQYQDPKTFKTEFYKLIVIRINPLTKVLRCTDYATGIENLQEFKEFFTKDAPCKKVGGKVSTIDNPVSGITGVFHIGKASFLKMSTKTEGGIVTFYSNNGDRGDIITMKIQDGKIGWSEGFRYPPENAHMAKPEIGLTVKVEDVVEELAKPTKIYNLVSKWFGILIKRGLKIAIRDDTIPGPPGPSNTKFVEPPKELDTKNEQSSNDTILSNGKHLSYCLKANLKPKYENIDIYKDHIWIKSIHVEYCVEGWINCDSFQLNGSRDGFQTGEGTKYTEGMKLFDAYLERNYDRQHAKSIVKGQEDMNKQLQKIMEQALKSFKLDSLLPNGLESEIPLATGQTNQQLVNGPNQNQNQQWERIDGVGIIDTGGDKTRRGKIIGPDEHGHCGPIIHDHGNDDNVKTYEENGGDHSIIKPKKTQTQPRPGPTKPNMKYELSDLTDSEPMTKMNTPDAVILNTSLQSINDILQFGIVRRLTVLTPLAIDAIVEFLMRRESKGLDITTYRKKCSDLYSRVIMLG
jgi:hypothetical protein